MNGTCRGPKPGRRRCLSEVHQAVERILAEGPRREECESAAQYERLCVLWAWEQRLRRGPNLAALMG